MTRLEKVLGSIFLLAVLCGVAAGGFFFGGFFSVAASDPDPSIVNWALIHVREASIARHAVDQPPASLDDPAIIRAGAQAYLRSGCVYCHGGPGLKPAPFSEGLNPAPNLKKVVKGLTPQELFWVVKNGIKMTGMPSFGSETPPVPDHDLWAIAAFLKKLPGVSSEEFKAWSAPQP
ncbi:MAG TPA: cytochrome c [Acidisoma sp.]|uniref:c-type cytochrome n=1 Tax=Acidisoma sp. TaxID=1872115 RepID=UPI002B5B9C98|nr:cytochrome c [Acidisoma sp.]HTH99990.1 cytochrome c [Acidisoma sp.]